MDLKQCRKCSVWRQKDKYWPTPNTADGLQYDCISCMQEHWSSRLESRRLKTKDNSPPTIRALIRGSRKGAKRDGIPFTLKPDDIFIPDLCPIRQVKMVRNQGKISPDSYSLDRRDNSKGYEKGNVFVISLLANKAKSDMTIEQVERLLKYMKGEL